MDKGTRGVLSARRSDICRRRVNSALLGRDMRTDQNAEEITPTRIRWTAVGLLQEVLDAEAWLDAHNVVLTKSQQKDRKKNSPRDCFPHLVSADRMNYETTDLAT